MEHTGCWYAGLVSTINVISQRPSALVSSPHQQHQREQLKCGGPSIAEWCGTLAASGQAKFVKGVESFEMRLTTNMRPIFHKQRTRVCKSQNKQISSKTYSQIACHDLHRSVISAVSASIIIKMHFAWHILRQPSGVVASTSFVRI
ncbi:hypothetical protein AVEN_87064-1 [Araneus ventricosus]|uniref:Uncharacterized protein n=1 Tax=Araneus ventricosus TaxID=182803 RepID=A0A4Y2PYC1_ARAVE|nr:hypothetical protein AVEN_87064-1 [Araneus ventricosus]